VRPGGKQVYQVAFSFKGVQCREVVALDHSKQNEAYCERLRAEILRHIELGTFQYRTYFPDSQRASVFGQGPAQARTLKTVLEAYRDRVKKTFEPSTFAGYRKAVDNVLVPWCGAKRLDELTPADIREWVGLQTVSLKRIRNLLLPLRAVLDEAVSDEVIGSSPLARIKLDKLVAPAQRVSEWEPDPYTEAEVITLLGRIPPPQRLAFQLWAYTGLRTGELVALRWPRIDLEAGIIRVVETTTERKDKARPKTAAGVRKIPLLPAAREALELMRAYTALGGDRATVNPKSTREDLAWSDVTLAKVWKAAHKGTGIEYRNPYQLRHTFASQLLSQGDGVAYIAKLLGHKTVEMVIRNYARHVEQGELLGFDRPPRQYGMRRLWDGEIRTDFTRDAA
jgi:integrase